MNELYDDSNPVCDSCEYGSVNSQERTYTNTQPCENHGKIKKEKKRKNMTRSKNQGINKKAKKLRKKVRKK